MSKLRPIPTADQPWVGPDGKPRVYEYFFDLDRYARQLGGRSVGVPSTRLISTGVGLTGGGDLSADRTISVQFGVVAGTVAEGNDSRIVGAAQASSLGTAAYAAVADFDASGSASAAVAAHVAASDPHPQYLTTAEGNAAYQPLDSDLTAIAALTTTSYGRSVLTQADAAALRLLAGTVIGTDVVAQSHVGSGGSSHANVVAGGASGFMTGADKTKLNSISSGADVTSAAFGAWTSYTPTVSAGSGSFTSASATGAYLQIGKLVFFRQQITITTVGTGATNVQATLPTGCAADVPCLGIYFNAGKSVQSQISGLGTARTYSTLYDGSFPFTDGTVIGLTGFYQAP